MRLNPPEVPGIALAYHRLRAGDVDDLGRRLAAVCPDLRALRAYHARYLSDLDCITLETAYAAYRASRVRQTLETINHL